MKMQVSGLQPQWIHHLLVLLCVVDQTSSCPSSIINYHPSNVIFIISVVNTIMSISVGTIDVFFDHFLQFLNLLAFARTRLYWICRRTKELSNMCEETVTARNSGGRYPIWFNSMFKFFQKWFTQYSIQYCFTLDSIQNIIQFKNNSADSIQKIIRFNCHGIIGTGLIGKVPKKCPK